MLKHYRATNRLDVIRFLWRRYLRIAPSLMFAVLITWQVSARF